MKKWIVWMLIGLVLAAPTAWAQPDAGDASQPVTHPQLAELLVRALGLARHLPNAPSSQQIFELLMQNGIAPQDGWKLDALVTRADLARVMILSLKMRDMVENPNDPQSWINALVELGIPIDRLSETIQQVEVLPEGFGQDVSLSSTDPLVYGMDFAPSTVQYTVDLNLTVRLLSEMEMVRGEFRAKPPTPH